MALITVTHKATGLKILVEVEEGEMSVPQWLEINRYFRSRCQSYGCGYIHCESDTPFSVIDRGRLLHSFK